MLVEVVVGLEGDWRRPVMENFSMGRDASVQELIVAPRPAASAGDEGVTLGGSPGSGLTASSG
jgi:carotenoid cleavage dioxygenase-like enzyme